VVVSIDAPDEAPTTDLPRVVNPPPLPTSQPPLPPALSLLPHGQAQPELLETPTVVETPSGTEVLGTPAPRGRRRRRPGENRSVERKPVPPAVFITMASVSALAGLLLFLFSYALGFSALQEQRSQHQLYAAFRGLLDPSSPIAPKVGGVISPGTPIALLNASSAGIHNAIVVEGTSSGDLMKGPGHLRDTPLPGQVGQSIVMGKSVTVGAPFRNITSLRAGEIITVTTGQSTFHFKVLGTRTAGSTLPQVPAGGSLLTLATSQGSGVLGSLAPGHVVYVDALLQDRAVAAPAGRPVAVPVSELPGKSDPSAWPYLVLWLQGFIIAGVASVWAWIRWGRWQTWLVGAPILLGVLWGLAAESMRLLPNLL
jgi:sortase A